MVLVVFGEIEKDGKEDVNKNGHASIVVLEI